MTYSCDSLSDITLSALANDARPSGQDPVFRGGSGARTQWQPIGPCCFCAPAEVLSSASTHTLREASGPRRPRVLSTARRGHHGCGSAKTAQTDRLVFEHLKNREQLGNQEKIPNPGRQVQ